MMKTGPSLRMQIAFTLCVLAVSALHQASAQERFKSPEQAVSALVDAAKAGNKDAILGVLGTGGRKIVTSGDEVADRATREKFVAVYETKHLLRSDGEGREVLVLGDDDWPFPIPLMRGKDGWSFDTAAGLDEILRRRIGRNELSTIEVMLAYVQAQNEYASLDPAGLGPHVYAQRILSSPGKKDGLYWPTAGGQEPSGTRLAMRRSPITATTTASSSDKVRALKAAPTTMWWAAR
jgi:hypothetical protein